LYRHTGEYNLADFDIFLSHSSKDKPKVELIYQDLIGQNFKVWFDKEDINGGDVWPQALQDGIDNSKVLVLIWTEEAKKSDWVQREIAWALSKNIPVIPMLMDNTELNISIQTIQFIDARSGYAGAFPELVSRINRYVESEPGSENQKGRAWAYQKSPFFRSQFLEDNGYQNRNADNFAANEWSQKLYESTRSDSKLAEQFVTFVCIPIPNIIDTELKNIPKLLQSGQQDMPNEQRINNSRLSGLTKSQQELVFHHQNENIGHYLRFNEDGVIELGDAYYSPFEHNRSGKILKGFRLISMLGAVWKLINFTANYYSMTSNLSDFQLLLNLKNTKDKLLDNFGGSYGREKSWVSPLNDQFGFSLDYTPFAKDKNLQFIYNIQSKTILDHPTIVQDIITDLSRKIQWAFNLSDEPRHNKPDTTDFDWSQFPPYFL
jgi:hypothetical protein